MLSDAGVQRNDRLVRWVGPALTVVAVLAVFSFALAALLPVYTDELVWKVIQGRFDFDGAQTLRLNPTCGPLGVPIPAILLPFRHLDTLLFEGIDSPLPLRIFGVGAGVAWLTLTCIIAGAGAGARNRRLAYLLVLSCATIGVMPFMLVINRPEQIMLIGLTLLALPLILRMQSPPGGAPRDIMTGAAYLIGGGILLSCHALAALFWPLIVLSMTTMIRRRVIAWPIAAALAVIAFVTIRNFGVRGACADPSMQNLFFQDNLLAAAGMGHIGGYLLAFLVFSVRDPYMALLIDQFQFKRSYVSDMLPPVGSPIVLALSFVMRNAFLVAGGAGLGLFIRWMRRAARLRAIDSATLAVGFLWAFWAFSVVDRARKNDYEAQLLMPILVMAIIGSIWVAREQIAARLGPEKWHRLSVAAILAVAGISAISQVALLATFAPDARRDWISPGYAPGQRFSVNVGGYSTLRHDIEATGALCGIDPASRPHHLVVDELTYYVYKKSFQPIFATYLDKQGWGRYLTDVKATLSALGSQGLVTGCQWVPQELRGLSRQNGQFCCVPSLAP